MTSQILVSLRVKTSPARAFEIFTRDIALWWTPNMLFQFTPRSPGTLAFEPHEGGRFTETLANGTVFEIGRIRVWQPGERLIFGWRQATFRPGQFVDLGLDVPARLRHAVADAAVALASPRSSPCGAAMLALKANNPTKEDSS